MARRKERSSDEWFRGRIRELEAENRRLKKQLRSAEKSFEFVLGDNEEDEKESICPDCSKGSLKFTDLKVKTLITCSICTYRKTENK